MPQESKDRLCPQSGRGSYFFTLKEIEQVVERALDTLDFPLLFPEA